MTDFEQRIIKANKVMIAFNKTKIESMKSEQSSLPKTHARHVELSQQIRELNQENSLRHAHNAEIVLES